MTSSLTKPPEDRATLTPHRADAVFQAAEQIARPGDGDARLLIIDAKAGIVHATPNALALFDAIDLAELQARLLTGGGPTARRLRRLAATLPIGDAPRLERIGIFLGRRSMGLNLRFGRIETPREGSLLLLWAPAPHAGNGQIATVSVSPNEAARAQNENAAVVEPPLKSRFLWSLDREGRFGNTDSVLARALGPDAPRLGETVDAWRLRTGATFGDDIVAEFEKRETFTDSTVVWPATGGHGRLRIRLSAAPVFERGRDFAGYRGFGRLEEVISASREATPSYAAAVNPGAATAVGAAEGEAESPGSPATAGTGAVVTKLDAETSAVPEMTERSATVPAASRRDEVQTDVSSVDELAVAAGSESTCAVDTGPLAAPSTETEGSPKSERIEGIAVVDPSIAAANAPPERTAEIYVLRQTHASASKIVPIRPGALEALGLDPAQGSGSESIELSKSERDAFREIARALVGRTSNPRRDTGSEGSTAEVELPADEGLASSRLALGETSKPEPAAAAGEKIRSNASVVLDRLPIGVLVVSDAQALYLNHTLLDLLGYRDFGHFADSNGLAAMFRGRDPQGLPIEEHGALQIVRADGQALAVDGHAQLVNWDGAPATLIAFRRLREGDIDNKRRVVEDETKSRNAIASELQEMLDHATDGAVTLNSAGRILSLNGPAEKLFHYDRHDVVGESVLMLLAPQSHPETTARLESLSRSSESSTPETPIQVVGRDRAGAALNLALTLGRIGSAEAPHYCALMRDMSREREAERKLAVARDAALAASAAKTDFLAQVSHEIRTPLHAILGFAEVMMEERFGPIGNERYKDYLKDIHASGKHVISLADDLLDLSKIEAGKLELAFAPVDANSLIRECVSMMQPQAARERIIMRVSLFERLPRVMVDERSLKQIILNLMSNAVKFNEPGGQVIVSTAVDAVGQAVIRVRDTGVGMNEGEVGLALEPFSQIGGAGRKGGAGLGLPLTKALVEANGAEFSIKSRRDQGTLIEIAFPIVRAAQ